MLPLKDPGKGPSCDSQMLGVAGNPLFSWLVATWLRPLPPSSHSHLSQGLMPLNPFALIKILGLGTTLLHCDLPLTQLYLQRPCFPMRSYSNHQGLGLEHLLGGSESTHSPVPDKCYGVYCCACQSDWLLTSIALPGTWYQWCLVSWRYQVDTTQV